MGWAQVRQHDERENSKEDGGAASLRFQICRDDEICPRVSRPQCAQAVACAPQMICGARMAVCMAFMYSTFMYGILAQLAP